MYTLEDIETAIKNSKVQLLRAGFVDSFYSGLLLNIVEEYLNIRHEPTNKPVQHGWVNDCTDSKGCINVGPDICAGCDEYAPPTG